MTASWREQTAGIIREKISRFEYLNQYLLNAIRNAPLEAKVAIGLWGTIATGEYLAATHPHAFHSIFEKLKKWRNDFSRKWKSDQTEEEEKKEQN